MHGGQATAPTCPLTQTCSIPGQPQGAFPPLAGGSPYSPAYPPEESEQGGNIRKKGNFNTKFMQRGGRRGGGMEGIKNLVCKLLTLGVGNPEGNPIWILGDSLPRIEAHGPVRKKGESWNLFANPHQLAPGKIEKEWKALTQGVVKCTLGSALKRKRGGGEPKGSPNHNTGKDVR